MRGRTLLWALMLAAVSDGGGAAVCAQGAPPHESWLSASSAHFRITYVVGLEALAQRAAASAERAHAALSTLVAAAPSGPIDIVITDNVDFSNGFAQPFPSNRMVIFAKPPVDVIELQYMHDWIDLVVTHELAHIFHLDVSGGLGRFVRRIFGRVPAAWPVFPAVGTPQWSVEGLAVGIESMLSDFGRIHGSYNEMVVRTAALEGQLDDIDRLTSGSPVWPGAARTYIYGSLFMDYLTRRFGADATARIVRHTAGAIIPPQLWFGRVARHALGVSFREAYEDWQRELRERYVALSTQLQAQGLTQTETLTTHRGVALYPRFSPDGRLVAYSANDQRTAPKTRVLDASTGAEQWSEVQSAPAPVAWLPHGELLKSDLQFTDPFRIYSDIYTVGGDRMTRAARLQDIDVARDAATAVAVENRSGTNRLVLVDLASKQRRALTSLDLDAHWTQPRFSPTGDRIAVGHWSKGGVYHIVVLDRRGAELLRIDAGTGVSSAPAWSPDGQWVLFSSDRTGIPNLYAAATTPGATPALRQVTNVLTGAFYPDVSPDARWIVFSAYHHDGFQLERMPYDPASWREPQPAALTQLAHERGAYAPIPLSDSVRTAVARADTHLDPAARYRAAPHLRPFFWLPVWQKTDAGDFFGAVTSGVDLVGRHAWNLGLAIDPAAGRTVGNAGYAYRGLPTLPFADFHPSITLSLARDWDLLQPADSLGRYIDEREDVAALGVSLTRARVRAGMGLSGSAELVRRSRYLMNAPNNRLRDPADDLVGVRTTAHYARYYLPTFAISRENGIALQLSGRQRWDRNPQSVTLQDGRTLVLDGSYRELTTWDAAYIALPFPGFARHVLAARLSALFRDGPGAALSGIGGESSSGIGSLTLISDLDDFGGSSRFLPVRGFDSDARFGSRAWTASTEYRLPLAFVTRSLRPLPIFVDRLSAAAFLDAGHAWCQTRTSFCLSTSALDAPLVGAGAELIGRLSFWGMPTPLRLGFAWPLQGSDNPSARVYFLAGSSF